MFLVTKQPVDNVMNEFLVQVMTGAVDRNDVLIVYDTRDCVIVLHKKVPYMFCETDARNFRKWHNATPIPKSTKPRPLNKPTAA